MADRLSDGYAAYQQVTAKRNLLHSCCWAHVRRKFVDAQKAQPKGKSGRADSAIAKIAKRYAVEKRYKQSDSTTRQLARENESKQLLEELKLSLEKTQQQVPPKNALGKVCDSLTSFQYNGWIWTIKYDKG